MLIKLIRNKPKGQAIFGRLFVDGAYFCDTLEHTQHAILAGFYRVRITFSPRFQELLPILDGVIGRTGIREREGFLRNPQLCHGHTGERGIRGHRPRCARPPRTPILCHGHPVQAVTSSNRLKAKREPARHLFLYIPVSLCKQAFNAIWYIQKKVEINLYSFLLSLSFPSSPLAEREGFEPPEPLSSTVFKTAAIDHSAISPSSEVTSDLFFFEDFVVFELKKQNSQMRVQRYCFFLI